MAIISVIVPVYKVEQYIYRCVDSILAQTFSDFELILVDDGSPDNCGKICDEYAEKDKRIKVIHQENGGLSVARNSGIDWTYENSLSEYITFIDSDDWIHPQYLEALYFAAKQNNVDVSICCHRRAEKYDEKDMSQIYKLFDMENMNAEELLINDNWNFNYAWAKLYKKTYFRDIRYPVGKIFEDTFTTYKVLFSCMQVTVVKQALYYYFKNENGISRSLWSPKELVILEGMEKQMYFYKQKNYINSYKKEEALYIHHHAYQISRIRENKKDLRKNKKYIRTLRRRMLLLMRQDKDKYNIDKMPYCYETAYPRIMRCYRLCKTFFSILRSNGTIGVIKKIKEKVIRR